MIRQIYSALKRKKVKQAVFLTPTGFKMVKDPGRVKYYDEYEYIGSFRPGCTIDLIESCLKY